MMTLAVLPVDTAASSGYSHWSIVDAADGSDAWTDVTIWFDLDDDDDAADVDSPVNDDGGTAAANTTTTYTTHDMCLPPGSYTLVSVPDVPYVFSYQEARLKCGRGNDYNFTLPLENSNNSGGGEKTGCIALEGSSVEEELVALQSQNATVTSDDAILSDDAEMMDGVDATTTADDADYVDNATDEGEIEVSDSDDAATSSTDDTKTNDGAAVEINDLDEDGAHDEGESTDTSSSATNNEADEIASASHAIYGTKSIYIGSILLSLVLLVSF
jgi:hypothetical protein